MTNIIKFFVNYNYVYLFIILEVVSLFLSIKHSQVKTKSFTMSANVVSGFVNEKISSITGYLNLEHENKKLVEENKKLNNKLQQFELSTENIPQKIKESDFMYISAEIIKNSVFKKTNFLTINKGKKDGIKPDMAVVSPEGIIGITVKVNRNFTTIISLLNNKLKISGKLKKTDYFGSITWNSEDYRYVLLNDIPNHAKIVQGDTVVTSGYSAIFPKNINVGVVEYISNVKESNFFKIKVKLFTDFKKIRHVYIIKSNLKKEKIKVEEETKEIFK